MKTAYIIVSLIFFMFLSVHTEAYSRDIIPLKGEWNYRLKGAPSSIPGEGTINLPNTLDGARKSVYNPETDETARLRREFSFSGEATYSRRIFLPETVKDKDIFLILERTRPSVLILNGDTVGHISNISAPQVYNLSGILSQGSHFLEIAVNNKDSIPPIVALASNAASESTQTNWNGILGDIYLEIRNPFHISDVRIKDQVNTNEAIISVEFSNPSRESGEVSLTWKNGSTYSNKIIAGDTAVNFILLLEDTDLWSVENPLLHALDFKLKDSQGNLVDELAVTTGFRDFSTDDRYFTINGHKIFLRGTVNAAIFPLTAYPPTDLEYWLQYFRKIKEYGLNHVRFHSWTPPVAAFQAADLLGVYLLVELPIWGELDRDLTFTNRFLKEELNSIMKTYAQHPSFVMFSPGNELWGDVNLMGDYMSKARELNPRILSTYGSNIYMGIQGEKGGEDFMISAKTSDDIKNTVRGSDSFPDSPDGGYFNSTYPETTTNFGKALEGITVPVISHEVGQYQTYPDFSEINEFTGILKPDNLKIFKERAQEAGTFHKNDKYVEASGKWAAQLYKAEMERAVRSPGLGGFELFGIQDYPGQGTAPVGILNVFMKDKGVISPENWNRSSSDLMLLAELPKYVFTEEETVEIPVLTANFTSNPDTISSIQWEIGKNKGVIQAIPGNGVIENGKIFFKIPKISDPQNVKLFLSAPETGLLNEYNLWIYPKNNKEFKEVKITRNLKEALNFLEKGEKVLLMPDTALIANASLPSLFTPDFWNYRMYRTLSDEMHLPVSPGTLGLLIDKEHPALNKFPTDIHTDWQWFSIVKNSRPLIIDRLPTDFQPIVEAIDNPERNYRTALLLECKVGKGKLMILPAEYDNLTATPEGRALINSIKEYMAGKGFNPEVTLSPEQLENLLTKPSPKRKVKELSKFGYFS